MFPIVRTGLLMALMLVSARLFAADESKSDSSLSAGAIRISDCRIVLIDHVILACDRSGILKSIECKEGQRVSGRQEVARIADDVAVANVAVAAKKAANDVEIRFARKACEMAEVEYRKNLLANEANNHAGKTFAAIPLMEIEKLKLAAEKGRLSIEQAQNELALNKLHADVARAEHATYSVFAEFDGVVTRVFKKKGEAVRQGDPIAELVSPDRVRIEGRVELSHLRFARQRAKIRVRLTVPELDLPEENEEFEGHITFVDLVSDPVTHETRIYGEVKNRDNILRAGLMAEMLLEREETAETRAEPPVKERLPLR